jgi:hypothetical protein
MEARILCAASKIMDAVTEFVEEGNNFVVFEK